MAPSVLYSFTITLKPLMFKKEPEDQYDYVIPEIVGIMNMISLKYSMVVELTKSYNIHLHGVIQFNLTDTPCIKRWYKAWRNQPRIGFTNIKQITDFEGWKEYITKSFKETMDNINRRPIIKDDLELWTPIDYALYGNEW